MSSEPVAAIVKYNPCTPYARLGRPCPHFRGVRLCGYAPGECPDERYDLWYREALRGRVRAFYPLHVRLLDEPGALMLIYHSHARAVVAEARVVRHTVEGGWHYYWFDELVKYLEPVPLELVRSDPRLPRLRGRWVAVYIGEEALAELRELAGLSGDLRLRLEREAARRSL